MRDFASSTTETWLLRLSARAGLAVLFAAVLVFLAPFGTYRFGAFDRLAYWTLQMMAWLVLWTIATALVAVAPGLRRRSVAQRRVAGTIVATMPMMVVTGVANNMMNGWTPKPEELAELFFSIALIGGGYAYLSDRLVANLGGPAGRAAAAPQPGGDLPDVAEDAVAQEEQPSDRTLIDRLPLHVRNDIMCLQVQDHYVRVHGSQSSAMVLMRFSDALRGVDHIPGTQVHRSWWVALDAVIRVRRTGRTAQLTLQDGTTVPVSQPYLDAAMTRWGALEGVA